MRSPHKSIILTCILFCSLSGISQINSDSINNKINHFYSIDTSNAQVNADLQELGRKYPADTILLIVKQALASFNVYTAPDSALVYEKEVLDLAKKINSKKDIAISYQKIGEILRVLGNYPKAVEFMLRSLPLAEELKDTLLLELCYDQLGIAYNGDGDNEKALASIFRSLSLINRPKFDREDSSAFQTAYIYLAEVYLSKNILDSALYYGKKAQKIDSFLKSNWSWISYQLGQIYAHAKNEEQALNYYAKALNTSWAKDSIDTYNGIAKLFLSVNKMDSAIHYANKALATDPTHLYLPEMLESATTLSNAYEKKNNKDSILKYLKLSVSLKDSIFNRDKIREVQSLSLDEQLRQQEIKTSEEIYRNKLRTYILSFALGVFLLIAFILFRSNRHRRKAYHLLQKQKLEIDIQKSKAEQALSDLKATQSQLIQSEKMASLGELTAGIAHEIQNPLNFVNNFSEVNKELVDELQNELRSGKTEEAIAISNDIKENEEKINHHGKRADAIVKGMLQHSRSSTGAKELTDINALADEYLRLAYHGLRAKDKEFNAQMKTDLDASVEKINVIPQDIGRVLLNLYNNAFYSTSEKKKQIGENYEPAVSLSTKKSDDKVYISVSDNGNGIAQKVVDKIFQPFFTTKPTGQGTGLGLSLSYDIIKAHGGEIKVETKEGEGSKFIIELPLK